MTSTGLATEGNELALGGDSGFLCLLLRKVQPLLSDVETGHAFAPSSAISFTSAPGPHPKSRTTLSLISVSIPGNKTRSLLFPA